MSSSKLVKIGFTAVLGIAVIGLGLWEAGLFSLSDDKGSNVIYDIDSESDWIQNSGYLWTHADSSFENGRLQTGTYGAWRMAGYKSAVNYRTEWVETPGEEMVLGTLEAKGYIGEKPDSALNLIVYDCTGVPNQANATQLENYCYDNPVYETGFIEEPGRVEITEDLSNVTIEGYVNIQLDVVVNSTVPVSEDQTTYWDSIKLTAEKDFQTPLKRH